MVKVKKRNKKEEKEKSKEKEQEAQEVLSKIKDASEEEEASILAKKNFLPYLDLRLFPLDIEDVKILSESYAKKYNIAFFQKVRDEIKVGLVNPESKEANEYLSKLEKKRAWTFKKYVISKSSLEKVLRRYKEAPLIENLDAMRTFLTGKDLEEFEDKFKDLIALNDLIEKVSTSKIINIVMAGAIKTKASDVHFEPQEEKVRLRYRIDGVLQDVGSLPQKTYKLILSRIKMAGKMKINVRDIAQDGHFSIKLEKNKIDVRISVIPGNHGESIVMRLLNQSDILLEVKDLGLQGLAYEKIKEQLAKPNGMILTTGPTGSGKTTTLYSFVNTLNSPEIKTITIEDPIEYELKGISQTQVSKSRGYTFAKGLRSIVRQDPDIVLVGEIRDEETAEIATQAALTGHLLLSTLHTNNAPASIPRLVELGIRPSLIASAVNAFIAQRLVRRLCPHCKKKYKPALETIESIKRLLSLISPKAKVDIPKNIEYVYHTVGCAKCNNIGYKGRIGIFEVLPMSDEIEKVTMDMEGESKISQVALEAGMVTMTQDGIIKALQGETSMEEVWRVTGQTDFLEELYARLMDQSLSRSISISENYMKDASSNISSFEKLNELVNKVNPKEIIETVFSAAILLGAGDIHIEPEEENIKIRFRIDGILQDACSIPLNVYPVLLGRIKLLSGLKTEARAGVKDSRFGIKIKNPPKEITGSKIDVRVSIISGGFGETVVLRLLNKSATAMEIDQSGIRKETLDKIIRAVKKPNGIFLNTGPTGSGKTTTLYTLLKMLNDPAVKIITVEDPIEYQLKGILQTQTNEKENYTFSTALKSLLRQNPDILMIGEIRDEETAKISVQSALTGHMLLSTLHTNDAAGSITRLLNMGVNADDLAVASNAFMAQRLVRRLCDCKEKVEPSEEERETIERSLQTLSPKSGIKKPAISHIYKPKGCPKCNGIGYKGRVVISEVLVAEKEMKKIISQGALSSEIRDKAIEEGMISMDQDGVLKVLEGETTLEEVDRVTDI